MEMIKCKIEKKDPIIKAIAENTIYSYEEIKSLYDVTKSYDSLISVAAMAARQNLSIEGTLNFVRQYRRPDMIRPLPLKDVFANQGVK